MLEPPAWDPAHAEGVAHPFDTQRLMGHEPLEHLLARLWRTGKMPHALMLAGPRGVGKATLAFRVARCVLSDGGAQAGGESQLFAEDAAWHEDPETAQRMRAGGHADFLIVNRQRDPKSGRLKNEIVVDDIRRLAGFFRVTASVEGGWRVAIIDAVDQLNRSAANALLKILEEPPQRSLLILVCHRPGAVLATLKSRCQLYKMSGLEAEDVVAATASALPDIDPDVHLSLVRLGQGSPGQVLALAEQDALGLYEGWLRHTAAVLGQGGTRETMDTLLTATTEARWPVLKEAIGWWMHRAARLAGTGRLPTAPVSAGEEAALALALPLARQLEQWSQLWDKLSAMLERADRVNLDRPATLTAITALIAEARSAAR